MRKVARNQSIGVSLDIVSERRASGKHLERVELGRLLGNLCIGEGAGSLVMPAKSRHAREGGHPS